MSGLSRLIRRFPGIEFIVIDGLNRAGTQTVTEEERCCATDMDASLRQRFQRFNQEVFVIPPEEYFTLGAGRRVAQSKVHLCDGDFAKTTA